MFVILCSQEYSLNKSTVHSDSSAVIRDALFLEPVKKVQYIYLFNVQVDNVKIFSLSFII